MEIVIGGGFAGLMVALGRLARGAEVLVLDATERPGGLVRSEVLGGCVIEHGPQSAQSTVELLGLVETLGLRDQILWPSTRSGARWIYAGGRLVSFPTSLAGVLRSPLWSSWAGLRALAEPWVPARAGREPESLRDALVRRFGSGVVDAVADAAIAGVSGGSPDQLDAATLLPSLSAWESDGGVLRGMARARAARPDWAQAPLWTLKHGLGGLVDAMAAKVPVQGGQRVRAMSRTKAGWRVQTERDIWEGARVWWTAPPPDDPSLRLPVAPRAPIVSIHLAWPREAVPVHGFGWLGRPQDVPDALGCLWVSSTFPTHAPGLTMVRVMLGGTRDPGVLSLSDEALVARALGVLARVQGLREAPLWTHIVRHRAGIPQHPPGMAASVAAAEASHPGLRLVGWAWQGPGLSGIARQARSAWDAPAAS